MTEKEFIIDREFVDVSVTEFLQRGGTIRKLDPKSCKDPIQMDSSVDYSSFFVSTSDELTHKEGSGGKYERC